MGTNASNKKVASKIVAILLAALMLISVMPMTAFAAPMKGETVTIDGFTLIDEPDVFEGNVGEYVDLKGLSIEITYMYDKDIENLGEKAPLKKEVITYSKLSTFIDKLDDFGVKCNYADYVQGSVADKKLTLNNNVESIKFFYGKDGKQVWDTKVCPVVYPTTWNAASKVNIYNDADYIVVVDGKYVLTNNKIDTTLISGALSENALAVQAMTIDNAAGIIKNIDAQLEKINEGKKDELKVEDIQWTADFDLTDGVYSVKFNNGSAKLSDKEVEANAIAKNEWALVGASKATDWRFADGNLYRVKSEDVKSVDGTVVDTKDVNYYVALADAGYLYLTKDATKAAQIDLYKIGAEAVSVEKIEIVKDADKMEYNVGEAFNADGMIVNLVYTDGTVICVPSTHFEVFNLFVYIEEGDLENLTIAENDQYIKVVYARMGENKDYMIYDMSNKALKVGEGKLDSFVLTDGELEDGLYAIVWSTEPDEDGKILANKTYEGTALTSEFSTFDRLESNKTDYTVKTLMGEDVTFRNNALGTDTGDVFVNGDNTTVWQITVLKNKCTIKVPGTETYLNRAALNKYDEWALVDEDGDKVPFEGMLLTLGEFDEKNSYWSIDGTVDAAIESYTTLSTETNYYTILDGHFIALDDVSDSQSQNFYFFKTEASVTATALEIIDQADSAYNSGEALDLSDLVVKVTYSNGTWVKVAYDDFNTYGITVNYANGATMTGADNGKNIVVSLGNINATGAALNVTDSKADVTSVRLGGADRYATAALIAESYVTALGADYANVAVLTSGTNYPDALAGATLANALKAPIVLTKGDALVDVTKTFLTSKAVKTVYIIGGTSAVSADVEATLKTMGIAVVRVEGTDRVETSLAVAKELAKIKGYNNTIILTNGANFADALSVSSAAAQKAIPVVYVNNTLSESTKAFIAEAKATNAIILGGDAAVSADVEAAVKALGLSVERIKGDDRFETSVAIAERFADVYTGKAVAFATGKDFPDALAGSVYAAFLGAPVVLLENGGENSVAGAYTAGLELTNVYVFGGEDALNTASVNNALLK